MILVAVPLCDAKAYAQTIALEAVKAQSVDLRSLVLFVDVQSPRLWSGRAWEPLQDWTARHGGAFGGVVIDVWWDTRDEAPADANMAARIRPITYAREKARVYALNRVAWVGHLPQAMPVPGEAGAAWYSPVTASDGSEFTHVWYVDADVEPPPDALRRLLALDAPLASGLFFGRMGNRGQGVPYVFQKYLQGIGYGVHYLRQPLVGVVEADFTGAGCLLVRHDVLQRVSWRHWKVDADETYWAEDAYFCFDAARAGFGRVRVDCGVICRHYDPSGAVT